MGKQQDPPKGKVDLFGAFLVGAKTDPNFNATAYAKEAYRRMRSGQELVFDPQLAQEKYASEYDDPEKFGEDLRAVQAMHELVKSAPSEDYFPLATRRPGTYTLGPGKAADNQFYYTDDKGKQQVSGGDRGKLASNMGEFIDFSGQRLPLTEKTLSSGRRFYIDDIPTDKDGRIADTPTLVELSPHQAAYGKEIFSRWGYKPMTGTWLGSAMKDMYNGLFELAAPVAAIMENSVGQGSTHRMKTLLEAMNKLDMKPTFASTVRDFVDGGVAHPSSNITFDMMKLLNPIGYTALSAADFARADRLSNEGMYDRVEELLKDEKQWREAAKKGDPKAKIAVQVMDIHHGIQGKTFLERLGDTSYIIKGYNSAPTSHRRDQQGVFGGMEGFSGLLGQAISYLVPQRAAAQVIGRGLLAAGGRGMVGRALVQNGGKALTAAGTKAVGFGAATVPSLQMGQMFYHGAREAGYKHDEAVLMASAAMPMIFLTEGLLSPSWMTRSLQSAGGTTAMTKALGKILGEAPASVKGMAIKDRALYMTSEFWSTLQAGSKNAFANFGKNVGEGFLKEGAQEGLEELGYGVIEDIGDAWTDKNLFAKSRPWDYSLYSRVAEAGLAGAVMGGFISGLAGGRRQDTDMRTIAAIVADGKERDLKRNLDQLVKDGKLSPDDYSAAMQDIALAKDDMQTRGIVDPQEFHRRLGTEDIVSERVQRAKKIRGLQEQIGAAGDTAAPELKSELAAEQAALAEIDNGTRLRQRYVQHRLADSAITEGRTGMIQPQAIDALADTFKNYVPARREQIETQKLFRKENEKLLHEQIDALLRAPNELGKIADTFSSLEDLRRPFEEAGAYTDQDHKAILGALSTKRSQILEELSREEYVSESEQKDLIDQAYKIANDAGVVDSFEEFIEMSESEKLSKDKGSAGKLYKAYQAVKQKEKELSEIELKRPDQKLFVDGATDEELMEEFMTSSPWMGTQRTFRSMANELANLTSPQRGHIDTLDSLMREIDVRLASVKAFQGPLAKLSEEFQTSQSRKAIAEGATGIARMQEDLEKVYKPAKALKKEVIDELSSVLTDLASTREKLAGQLDLRSEKLEKFRWNDMEIRYNLVAEFAKGDPDLIKNEEYQRTFRSYSDLNEKDDHSKEDIVQMQVWLSRMQDMISEVLIGDPSKGTAFVGKLLGEYDFETTAYKNYMVTHGVSQRRLEDYYTSKMFIKGEFDPAVHGTALVMTTVNWISELSRTRHAEVVNALKRALKEQKFVPNAEQQVRVQEIVSFLNDPSDRITKSLLTAVHEQGIENPVPRSMLLPGQPGVGKTTMARMITDTVSEIKGRPLKVLVIAPGSKNIANVAAEIKGNKGHEVTPVLLSDISQIKDGSQFDLVLFDECHNASSAHLNELASLMERAPKAAGLFLGDSRQSPAITATTVEMFPVENRMMRTLPMHVSFRHGNVPLLVAQDEVAAQVFRLNQEGEPWPQLPSMEFVPHTNRGVRVAASISDVEAAFAKQLMDAVSPDGKASGDAVLIVYNEKERSDALARISSYQEIAEAYPPHQLAERIKHMGGGENSVLSLEHNTAFVALHPDSLGNLKGSHARFLYTALSRAKEGAVIFHPSARSRPVNTVQVVTPDPQGSIDAMNKAQRELIDKMGSDLQARLPKQASVQEATIVEPGKPDKITEADRKPKETPSTIEETPDRKVDDIVPKEAPAPVVKTPLVARGYAEQTRHYPVVMAGAFPYNDEENGRFTGINALDKDNRFFRARMSVLREVFASVDRSQHTTRLVYRKEGRYNNLKDTKPYVGKAIEVHLEDTSYNMAALKIAMERAQLWPKNGMTYQQMYEQGYTALGFMKLSIGENTAYEGDDLALLQADAARMKAAMDSTSDGDTIVGFENLPLVGMDGLRGNGTIKANQVEGKKPTKPFYQLEQNMERRGWILSPPASTFYVKAGEKDATPGLVSKASFFEGGPQLDIIMRTQPADKEFLAELRKEIGAFAKSKADPWKLKQGRANAFMLFNQSRIKNDAELMEQLKTLVAVNDNGYLEVVYKGKAGGWVKSMNKILDILEGSTKFKNSDLRKPVRIVGNGDQKIIEEDKHLLLSDHSDIQLSDMRIDLTRVLAPQKTTAAPKRGARLATKGGYHTSLKVPGSKVRMESRAKAETYFRKVLGDRFLNGKLDFRPGLTTADGRELWGVMQTASIALNLVNGQVRAGVARHEAVHYVIDVLLDSDSRYRVLWEAKQKIDPLHPWEVTDQQAHELIAVQAEKPTYDTSTLLGRFVRWLKNALAKWNIYRSEIDTLLYQIESGYFRDASEVGILDSMHYSPKQREETSPGTLAPAIPNEAHFIRDPFVQKSLRDTQALVYDFGSSVHVAELVSKMGREALEASQYQQPMSGDLFSPVTDFASVRRSLFDDYRTAHLAIDPVFKRADGTEVHFGSLTQPDTEAIMRSGQRDAYVDWKWGQPAEDGRSPGRVFNTLFQAAYPGLDVEKMAFTPDRVNEITMHLEAEMLEAMSAMVHNDNDTRDAWDSASGLAKAVIASTRLLVKDQATGKDMVDPTLIADRKVFQEVLQMAAAGIASSENDLMYFADNLQKIAGMVQTGEKVDAESSQARHARALYRRLFDMKGSFMENVSGQMAEMYSYAYLVNMAPQLMTQTNDPVLRRNLQMRVLKAKAVLASVIIPAKSASAQNVALARTVTAAPFKNNKGDLIFPATKVQIDLRRANDIDHIKATINEETSRWFMPIGKEQVDLAREYRSRWIVGLPGDGKDEAIIIDETGVTAPGGRSLVRKGRPDFHLEDAADKETVSKFFEYAGYRISDRTLDFLLDDKDGRKFLAKTIGYWAYSIHAGIHSLEAQPDGLFSIKALDKLNSMEGGVGRETAADIHTSGSEDASGISVPQPSILFAINEKLAEYEKRTNGAAMATRIVTPSGKRLEPYTLGHAFSTIFPASAVDKRSSDTAIALAPRLISMDPAMVYKDGEVSKVSNSVLNGSMPINDIFAFAGIRERESGVGTDLHQLTELDIETASLELFAHRLFEGGAEELLVPLKPHGDRNKVLLAYMKDPFGRKRIFEVSPQDKYGKRQVKFDRSALHGWIKDAFRYHAQAMEQTAAKWRELITVAGTSEFTPEFMRAQSHMMENRDWREENGKVVVGNAILNTDNPGAIYSKQNVDRVMAAINLQGEAFDQVIAPMFDMHYQKWRTHQQEIGFVKPSSWRTDAAGAEALYEGYFWMHHLVDKHVSALTGGDAINFKNAQDKSKRSVLDLSPGQVQVVAPGFGMPEVRVGVIPETPDKALDGQAATTPWGFQLLKAAYGGDEGVMRHSVNKMVIAQNNFHFKSSQAIISPQLYERNGFWQQEVRRSLRTQEAGDTLLELWDTTLGEEITPESFARATQAVIDMATQNNWPLTHIIGSDSNVKMGLRSVNYDTGVPTAYQSISVDPRFLRYQTNLERSLKELNAPFFSQIAALIHLSPADELIDEMARTEAKITKAYLDNLQKEITSTKLDKTYQDPDEEFREQVKLYLRDLGRRRAATSEMLSQVTDLFMDEWASLNGPILRRKVTEYLANELSTKALQPKMHGQMFTQVTAHGFMVQQEVQQPRQYTEQEQALLGKALPDEETQELRQQEGLERITQAELYDEEGREELRANSTVTVSAPRPLRPPGYGAGGYQPGECLMPFTYVKQFFPLKSRTNPNGYTQEQIDNILAQPIDAIRTEIITKHGQIGQELFDRAMKVYVVRVPSSAVSSGQWFNVVGFINDTGSSIYVPPGLNKYTGGDYDGDQLMVYMRRIEFQQDEEGNRILSEKDGGLPLIGEPSMNKQDPDAPSSIHQLQTQMMDLMEEFYADPMNRQLIEMQVGPDRFRAALEAVKPVLQQTTEVFPAETSTPYHSMISRKQAADGTVLIGASALMMKAYAYMVGAQRKYELDGGTPPFKGGWEPSFNALGEINAVMNACLDNVKLGYIGEAGINVHNISMLFAALAEGKTLEEAIALVNDPVVVQAVYDVERSRTYTAQGRNRGAGVSYTDLIEQLELAYYDIKERFDNTSQLELPPNGVPGVNEWTQDQLNSYAEWKTASDALSQIQTTLRYAYMGEAISRLSNIVSISTKGVPYDQDGLIRYKYNTELALGTDLKNFLHEGSRSSEDFLMKIHGFNESDAEFLEREKKIREYFEPADVIEQLPSVMYSLGVVDFADTLLQSSLLAHHPKIRQMRAKSLAIAGVNGTFRGDGEKLYQDVMDEAIISLYLSQIQSGSKHPMLKDESIDLSRPSGQWRFVMEFPDWFQAKVDQAHGRRDKRIKELLGSNLFLKQYRIAGQQTRRLEMKDARAMMDDPRMIDLVRRDVELLNEIIGPGTSELMFMYSLIKDRFSVNRNSMMRFMPRQFSRALEQWMDGQVHNGLSEDVKSFTVGGVEMTLQGYLDNMAKEILVAEPRLLKRGRAITKKDGTITWKLPKTGGELFVSEYRSGFNKWLQVRSVEDPDTVLFLPSTLITPRVTPFTRIMEGTNFLRGFNMNTYRDMFSGKDVTITSPAVDTWDVSKPLVLPSGQKVKILSVDAETSQAKLAAITKRTHDLDRELPHHKLTTTVVNSYQDLSSEQYGRNNAELDDKSLTDVLTMVAARTKVPAYKELAERLLKEQAITQREAHVFAGHDTHISGRGTIIIGRDLIGAEADWAILHEALHRFTMHAFDLSEDQLDEETRMFREAIKDIHRQALPSLNKLFGQDIDEQEMLVEAFGNKDVQEILRRLGPKSMSLWQKLVNAIRNLLGIGRNDLLSRVLDLTGSYIDHASRTGQAFNNDEASQHFMLKNPRNHGVIEKLPPIKDIKDIAPWLMKDAQKNSLFDISVARQTEYIMENVIDWTRGEQEHNGTTFDISGMSRDQVRKMLSTKVVPEMRSMDDRFKETLVDMLNSGNFEGVFDRVAPDGSRIVAEDADRRINLIKDKIGHSDGDLYVQMSSLRDKAKMITERDGKKVTVADLGLEAVEKFTGFDPIIRVRKVNGRNTVTLMDLTRGPLSTHEDPRPGSKLLRNLVNSGAAGVAYELNTLNDEAGMRVFLMGMQAMALKKANPDLVVRSIKAVSLKSTDHRSMWLYDLMRELEVVRGSYLMKELPAEVQQIISDPKLLDAKEYGQAWLEQYMDWLRAHEITDELKATPGEVRTRDLLLGKLDLDQDTIEQALKLRQRELERRDGAAAIDTEEYQFIAGALYDIVTSRNSGRRKIKDHSLKGHYLRNVQDAESALLQAAVRVQEGVSMKINRDFSAWRPKWEEQLAKLDKAQFNLGNIKIQILPGVDYSWKRFERLWMESAENENDPDSPKIYDHEGKLVKRRINRIHWDKNDPRTKKALAEGRLAESDLEVGSWIADQVQENLVMGRVHNMEMGEGESKDYYYDRNGKFLREQATAKAWEEVRKYFPKGQMPVNYATSAETNARGDFKRGVSVALDSMKATDDPLAGDNNAWDGDFKDHVRLGNRYLEEFDRIKNGSGLGSNRTLDRMGLARDTEGRTVIIKEDRLGGMTMNLETILFNLKQATLHQILHERHTIPAAQAVKARMRMLTKYEGFNQDRNEIWLQQYLDRMVYQGIGGTIERTEQAKIGDTDIAPVVKAGMSFTSLAGTAISWNVAVASGMFNFVGGLGTSIASGYAKDGIFGTKEFMQAMKMVMTSREHAKKMGALLEFYSITNAQESDQGNFRNRRTRRNIANGHVLNFLNYWTDHNMRGVVMVAQMLKDKTWDAHSIEGGKVKYDVKKDRRFYKEDGSLEPHAQTYMKGLREELHRQDFHGQKKDGPLVAAYDERDSGRFKWISDKYVIGAMDRSQDTMLGQYWFGRLFTMFRKHLPSRLANAYDRSQAIEKGGKYVVNTDSVTGEERFEWEVREITSQLQAVLKAYSIAKDAMQYGWKETQSMTKAEKRAMAKLGYDIAIFAVLWLLYQGLTSDDEEEKIKGAQWDYTAFGKRFTTIFNKVAWDSFSASIGIIDSFGGNGNVIPVMGMAKNLMDSVTDPSKITKILPARTLISDTYDLYDQTED